MVLVQRNLLLVPFHLAGLGHVPGQAELPADDVREQHAERLRGPAGRADRAGVVELDVGGVLAPLPNVHLRETLEGGDEDPFRQDRETDPERRVDPRGDRFAARTIGREPTRDGHGHLLARHGRGQGADLGRDPLDPEMGEQLLDPHRHVLRPGDLGGGLGVVSLAPGAGGDIVRSIDRRLDRPKVRFHEVRTQPRKISVCRTSASNLRRRSGVPVGPTGTFPRTTTRCPRRPERPRG